MSELDEEQRVGRTIYGTPDRDRLHGNFGDDTIFGLASPDVLKGDTGRDTLSGGGGNDVLFGGDDRDYLIGGDGRDRFCYTSMAESGQTAETRDIITDFHVGIDKIDLSIIDGDIRDRDNDPFTFNAIDILQGFNNTTVIVANNHGFIKLSILLKGIDPHTISASDFIL